MAIFLRSEIEERVRVAGLKLTPQRFAVLDYLMRNSMHPTAEQITIELNRRFPRASRATIYNTLHALRDAGLVREMFINDAAARYDANTTPHHHFVCRLCGMLEDVLPNKTIHAAIAPAAALTAAHLHLKAGYHIENYDVLIRGVCAACSR